MENFFQANGIWLAIVAFIPGLILLIKSMIEENKRNKGECWFGGSTYVMIWFVVVQVLFFLLVGLVDQNWKTFGIIYLDSLGLLFLGYILYKIGKSKASAIAGPDQEVKNSQTELEKRIKKEKEKMNIR